MNGLLVTYGRLSGIVVTLGVMFVLDGINVFITGGYQVPVATTRRHFSIIGQGKLGFIGVPVVIICSWSSRLPSVVATETQGRPLHCCSRRQPDGGILLGHRRLSLGHCGIRAVRAHVAGSGGVILTSISSSAQPVGGEGYLLEAFAAVFLGATVLGKGKPHLLGTLIGVFFLYMVELGDEHGRLPVRGPS